jgi:hypothetical protein
MGHPAHPTGGRFPRGASRPSNGRNVIPHYLSPPLTPNSHNIHQKSTKKKKRRGREERRGSDEALSTRRFAGIIIV